MKSSSQLRSAQPDWGNTLGQVITHTTTIAGLMTASPLFGPVGRLSGGGVMASIAIGSTMAVLGMREDRHPFLCYQEEVMVVEPIQTKHE
ncbi:hypothetical protein [Vibrio gangliei]|uniref:hypothetical protein n=1 Tax=Vibrio gangliei TaxID=2077090 RepID=UPI000D01A272|nr:hypothetical protein [Vibrio gangliei]